MAGIIITHAAAAAVILAALYVAYKFLTQEEQPEAGESGCAACGPAPRAVHTCSGPQGADHG